MGKNVTPLVVEEHLLGEKVVIMLQGTNFFGDQIFSYLELTVEKLQELTVKMQLGQSFNPSDFGTVIAAGKGVPSEELVAEMKSKHNMVEVPKAPPKSPAPAATPSLSQPKPWSADDDSIF